MFLLDNLNALRAKLDSVRPEACCKKTTMVEHGKGESIVCRNDCPWQEVDKLLATAMIDAEILCKK